MSTRYPGGLIRKTPPTITPPVDGEGGSAPGVWTLEQASYYTKQGTWPLPVLPKSLFSTGLNGAGQLGLNDVVYRSSPVQVGALTNWSQVSGSGTGTFGIQQNNTLWAWGAATYGALGTGDSINRSSPVQIGALTTWSSVVSGYYCGLAIKTDGTLWAWGLNNNGQLGIDSQIATSSPVQVGSDTNWSQVSTAIYMTAAIKNNGAIYVWGAGQSSNGQLGLNDQIARSSPTQIGALTTWLNVSVGQYCTVSTKTDGTLWAWGVNAQGRLGDGTVVYRSSPVQIGALTSWSLARTNGYRQSMARRNDGTLWLWGSGSYGALGQNNTDSRSSPVQLGSDTNWSNEFVPLYANAMAAIKTNGTLWGWGLNSNGRLGTNNTTTYSSPVQIGSDTNWLKTSAYGLANSNLLIKRA
jgi:alpha-tubulin suppressor-like RCC1 family protein